MAPLIGSEANWFERKERNDGKRKGSATPVKRMNVDGRTV
jgi:hypothetical protein